VLEARAHNDPPVIDRGRHPGDELAMLLQTIERTVEARRVERLGRDAHVFQIVAERPDNIPRSMGYSTAPPPPIEEEMLQAHKPAWLPLGALLVREGLISNDQLELALIDQQGTGLRLGELLVQWGWVESAAISKALAEQYDMEFIDLDAAEIDPVAIERLSAKEARARSAIPIRVLEDGHLLVGVADPTDVGACDELRALLGGSVSLVVVDQTELHRTLARQYS
jgi:hypothetical protein